MAIYIWETTTEEVAADCQSSLSDKSILVTGASPSGLGVTFAIIAVKYGPASIEDGSTYNRWAAHGQAKTANLLYHVVLAKKLGHRNLVSISLHPGIHRLDPPHSRSLYG
ncbi:hypothetical protein F5Y16DRAFT_233693 [Xylariaceae sp. FL0255]|nr:hypothetical protein F5Y16DRAFT_233693 [Xylariaceae sp. FL0255]